MSSVNINSAPESFLAAGDHESKARSLLHSHTNGFDLFIQAIQPIVDIKSSQHVRCRIDVGFWISVLIKQKTFGGSTSSNMLSVDTSISLDINSKHSMRRSLEVNQTEFFYRGNPDFVGVTSSQRIPIDLITGLLNGDPASIVHKERNDVFRWVGGSLLYAENDLDDFAVFIIENYPEVKAKETALLMAEQIVASTGSTVSESGTASSRRHSLRL